MMARRGRPACTPGSRARSQREGRIVRQGNNHDEMGIYAYGSVRESGIKSSKKTCNRFKDPFVESRVGRVGSRWAIGSMR